MTEIEREMITALYKGAVEEKKRRVLTFENPRDPEHDLKFSVFKPNMPEMVMGKTYEIAVEHVPMADGSGKKYHNLARTEMNGPYIYKEVGTPTTPSPPRGAVQAARPVPRAEAPKDVMGDAKEAYWEKKGELDKTKNAQITRLATLNTSVAYYQATVVSRTAPPTVEEVIKTAEEMEKWVKQAKP